MNASTTEPPFPTTVIRSSRLASRLERDLVVVSETFQETGSFKFRAASNVVASVDADLFLTASSGNFGQALARACQIAGRQAIVVMPSTSSRIKQAAVKGYGATVELFDPDETTRAERLGEVAQGHPGGYVASPYDDPLVIAGNASLGREISLRVPDCQAVVVPIGGGGLASGILVGLREAGHPAEVWGAEPALANDAARSLRSGRLERLDHEPMTLADGARTPSLGKHNWAVLKDGLRGIVEVGEPEIARGVRILFQDVNLKAEPTGTLAIGAVLSSPESFAGRQVVAVVSGGNVDTDVYAELISEAD